MKDALKSLGILIIGLFVAIIAYPFLHETGHSIAAVLAGAKIVEFDLLPIPSILCDASGVSTNGLVAVGFGGILFPIMISITLPRKWFFTWYFRALLQGISVLALVVSFVSVLFKVNPTDDMFQVLRFWQFDESLLLLILSCGIAAVLILIVIDRPGRRICKFFEL